jgi:hypothetical protein
MHQHSLTPDEVANKSVMRSQCAVETEATVIFDAFDVT